MELEFNQRAELPIADGSEDQTFKAREVIDVTVISQDDETISFNWEGWEFEEVPKFFFANFN